MENQTNGQKGNRATRNKKDLRLRLVMFKRLQCRSIFR